jgi:diguanylate cyclase (GGDEF)-like protein
MLVGKNILVVDPVQERREGTVELLTGLRAVPLQAADGGQALATIENSDIDMILCAQDIPGHSARELCDYVHEFVSGFLPFALMAEAKETAPGNAGRTVGADAVLVHPLSEHQVSAVAGRLFETGELKTRVLLLEEENAQLRKSMREMLHPDPETRLQRFDLFKQVILMEVKKARRYGFALSMLLLAIDNYQEVAGWLSPDQRQSLFSMLHRALVSDIRDIDIPVLFAEQKILVVMPHTNLEGAAVVADRIRDHVTRIKPPSSLTQVSITVSVAVATTEGLEEVSFGKMVQQAMRGLHEAEIKGGNLIIVCKPPSSGQDSSCEAKMGGKLGPRTFFV